MHSPAPSLEAALFSGWLIADSPIFNRITLLPRNYVFLITFYTFMFLF